MKTERAQERVSFEASIDEWNTVLRLAAEGMMAMSQRPDVNHYRLEGRLKVYEGFVTRLRGLIGMPDK